MRTAIAVVVALTLLSGWAAAEPIDFAVWVQTSIRTGPVTPEPAPGVDVTNSSVTAGTFDSISSLFNDAGQALDTNRDFEAHAEADLTTGELRLFAGGQGGPAGLRSNSSVSADAMIVETLNFNGTFGGEIVSFSANLDGFFDVLEPLGMSFAGIGFKAVIAPASFVVDTQDLTDRNSVIDMFGALDAVEIVDVFNTDFPMDEGFNERTLEGSFAVTGTNPSYKFFLFGQILTASKSATNEYAADYLNTATIVFDFGGLSVTSASGAFPLGPTAGAAVPEPGTFALGAAFMAVLLVRRRRRS